MSELNVVRPAQQITSAVVAQALNLTVFHYPHTVEAPAGLCDWPKLCGPTGCQFPRYFAAGQPHGLVANVLIALGYPVDLLKALDTEYELGEVLHPGVKIGRSRNAALARIDRPGVQLLTFLQERRDQGRTWSQLADEAMRRRRPLSWLDARRRPWLS